MSLEVESAIQVQMKGEVACVSPRSSVLRKSMNPFVFLSSSGQKLTRLFLALLRKLVSENDDWIQTNFSPLKDDLMSHFVRSNEVG